MNQQHVEQCWLIQGPYNRAPIAYMGIQRPAVESENYRMYELVGLKKR